MKRGPGRAWPKTIVEVPSARPDPRGADPRLPDPHATQKISREQLDEALRRTKSGTRLAVRSEPEITAEAQPPKAPRDRDRDSFAGPRDDEGPQITIVQIDSIELSTIDPSSLPMSSLPLVHTPSRAQAPVMVIPTPGSPNIDTGARTSSPRVVSHRGAWTQRLQITPRLAFIAGLTLAMIVLFAAAVGFFFGRGIVPSR